MLFTSLLLALSAAATDTLQIDRATVEGPYAVEAPYAADTLNNQGKPYDAKETLDANTTLVTSLSSSRSAKSTSVVRRNEALALTDGANGAIRVVRFNVQTAKFTKGTVKVDGIKNCKLFVNRVESADKSFTLTPGRTEMALLVFTQKADADTFRVSLVGEGLGDAKVNAEGKRPYTMADMLLGNQYRDVELSPLGRYLVTTSYYMKADGTAPYTTTLTELATGREILRYNEYIRMTWQRGKNDVLTYVRKAADGRELVFFDPATRTERVVASALPEGIVAFSPKADYVIYSKNEDGKKETNGLKRLQDPDDRMPGWRTRSSLWRHDLKTGLSQRLTFGKENLWLCDISASGKSLLVATSSFDAHKQPFDRTAYLRMDAYTGKVDTLIADTVFVADAKFSPDEKQLLVKASPASFNSIGSEVKDGQFPNAFDYRLYLYDIASRTTKPLLPNFAPSVDDYTWETADGNIYFRATDGCDETLYRLEPQSLRRTRYTLPVSYVQGWSLSTATSVPTVVYYGQTGERAREMFTATLSAKGAGTSRRIGPNNFDEMYPDVQVGHVADWSFKATRGDSIKGFYILPPDFDASKKYPLIVYYYGGCTPTGKTLQFQYPLQVLAGQGYVIYVCEPSGAIGYGQEFAARHVNTWGKESGDDIIEGTKRFLEEHPFVDATKVGCMGASYGGFMTQYLQTRTDIFAAAVSHAGISNIASYWGGGYWGYTYGQCAQYGSYPWNNPDLYVKQSPLFNADKIHTPLLLLHGTVDTNVPTNESQQMYTALKILGRDVSYIQVEDANHVVTDFKKRLVWQNAIFAWFAKYLQGNATWWNTLYPEK